MHEMGFTERGFTLPETLDISRSSFWQPGDWCSNVVLGGFEGVETVAFDFEHRDDFGYTQTVVAMKSNARISTLPTLLQASKITAERVGDWIVMFRPKEEIGLKGLPALLADCRVLLRCFEDKQAGAHETRGPSTPVGMTILTG
jgi:hypothetical protein